MTLSNLHLWAQGRLKLLPQFISSFQLAAQLEDYNQRLTRSREENREAHVLTYEPVEEIDLEFTRS